MGDLGGAREAKKGWRVSLLCAIGLGLCARDLALGEALSGRRGTAADVAPPPPPARRKTHQSTIIILSQSRRYISRLTNLIHSLFLGLTKVSGLSPSFREEDDVCYSRPLRSGFAHVVDS